MKNILKFVVVVLFFMPFLVFSKNIEREYGIIISTKIDKVKLDSDKKVNRVKVLIAKVTKSEGNYKFETLFKPVITSNNSATLILNLNQDENIIYEKNKVEVADLYFEIDLADDKKSYVIEVLFSLNNKIHKITLVQNIDESQEKYFIPYFPKNWNKQQILEKFHREQQKAIDKKCL